MVMALRRKVESFYIRVQPLEQRFKWFRHRRAREATLRGQNCFGHGTIVHFAASLQDEVETMNGRAAWPKKFFHGLETWRH